jgi:hypothetical protein
VFSFISLIGLSFSSLIWINGMTDYANDLPSSYGGSCQVCHVSASGGESLNSFGRDYAEHGNDVNAISNLDSDSDGHTNGEELKAGTFPGDPDSSPVNIGSWMNYVLVGIGLVLLIGIVVKKMTTR